VTFYASVYEETCPRHVDDKSGMKEYSNLPLYIRIHMLPTL